MKAHKLVHPVSFEGTPTALLAIVVAKFNRWRSLASQRRALARLDDEALKDIGVSRADATREAKRPFWDDSWKSE